MFIFFGVDSVITVDQQTWSKRSNLCIPFTGIDFKDFGPMDDPRWMPDIPHEDSATGMSGATLGERPHRAPI